MALMTCTECKKEVSDSAKTCPHCGAKVKKLRSPVMSSLIWVLLFVTLFAVVASVNTKPEAAPASPEEIAKTKRYVAAVSASKSIRAAMRDPESLKYETLRVNDDASVVCAEYRARNGFGGLNREHIMITDKGSSQEPRDWNKHCTKTMHDMLRAVK